MMNKTKSAKRQLLRMLFLLPATAILLLAFRNKLRESNGASAKSERLNNTLPISNIAIKQPGIISDTIPGKNFPKDYKEFLKRNPQIENLQWSGDPFSMTINLKNGSKETYNLENKKEIAGLEKKYGKLPAAPSLLPGSVKEIVVTGKPLSEVGELDEVKGVTVTEVPIKVVTADLSEVVVTGKPLTKTVPASTDLKAVAVAGKSLKTTVAASTDLKEVAITGMPITADISTPVKINPGVSVIAPIDLSRSAIALDEEILVTISKNSTRQQLEDFKQQAKQKGGELTFEDVVYNDKGILTNISGTITSKDGRSNFSASDFENLILLLIRDGDSTYFKVKINGNKNSIRTSGKKTRLS